MDTVNCIFACGEMRNFVSPIVWINRPERIEFVFNLKGRICDKCGAIALIPQEARAMHDTLMDLGAI